MKKQSYKFVTNVPTYCWYGSGQEWAQGEGKQLGRAHGHEGLSWSQGRHCKVVLIFKRRKYLIIFFNKFMKTLTWTQFLREYFLQHSCKSQHRSDSPAGKKIFRFLDSHPGKEISRAEACQGNDPWVFNSLLWSQPLTIAMYQQRFLQNSHV